MVVDSTGGLKGHGSGVFECEDNNIVFDIAR
jgi:hypothetical protein